MQSYTTQPFCGTPSSYVKHVGGMLLVRWWWAVAIPLIACLILSLHEAVWLFVAMMLLFLLYPGLTMMIYFNYAFSPEAQRTLHEQTVTVTEKHITVTYTEKNRTLNLTANDIAGIEFNSKHTLIKLKTPRYNHLAIPATAIDEDKKEEFYRLLSNFSPTVA